MAERILFPRETAVPPIRSSTVGLIRNSSQVWNHDIGRQRKDLRLDMHTEKDYSSNNMKVIVEPKHSE